MYPAAPEALSYRARTLEFKNAYGTLAAMLFIALAVPTVLAFAEQSKRIAALAFERSSAALTKRIGS